jgi:hypothetical protein
MSANGASTARVNGSSDVMIARSSAGRDDTIARAVGERESTGALQLSRVASIMHPRPGWESWLFPLYGRVSNREFER